MRKFRSVTSASDANLYVGPFGEIVVDDSGQLRIQDNVTAGGHLITAETGNIVFNGSTISTVDPLNDIRINSAVLTVSDSINVGNLLLSNNNIVTQSNVITFEAGTHSMVFRDVSSNLNQGPGIILKFDSIASSDGPYLNTWYGQEGNPYDPPGQHSLDIIGGSNADIDYVEFASYNWDNYIGVDNTKAFIHTNWNGDPTQAWVFLPTGAVTLTPQGIINSFNKTSNINLTDSNVYISTVNQTTGDPFGVLIDNGNITISGNLIPSGNITYDLGTLENQWRHLYVSSNTIYVGGASLTVINDELLVNGSVVGGGTVYDQSLNITDNVTFNSVVSDTHVNASEYRLTDAVVSTSAAPVTVLGAATSVVYTFDNWFTSAKFVFQTEGQLDGDSLFVDHTQTCEATVAATYNTTADPIMSVYGVVYTSIAPLATFTVRRGVGINAGKIEILATNSQTTNDLTVKVHATQFVSRYD
jgi:hypothetical protein